jgi:hypothetical protein
MVRCVPIALAVLTAFAASARAQAPAPADAPNASNTPRTMVGTWEFSNADREKSCTVTFRSDATRAGKKLTFDPACAGHFAFVRDIVAWSQEGNDFLRLFDARGQAVLEFSEVEGGIFEAPRPGEGILFIQQSAKAGGAPRSAEQATGDWSIVRGGRPICVLTLTNAAAGGEFAVRVRTPCDAFVTRFGPATWQIDRGELVFRSARGQFWRFEAADGANWQRVPESANPVLLVRN